MSRRGTVPYDVAKRVLDICGASIAIALTLPLQAVVAGLVLRELGRPVLFRQQRPGRDGKLFTLVKFRSMRSAVGDAASVSSDAQRLTAFGRRLRSTSMDELPSLFNVLKGDMSMVGPRPLLVQYLTRYSPNQARRHEVRPGVTGLAQVKGRNALGWDEKFLLDVEYVDRRSFSLDFRILVWTVTTVLRRDGVAAPSQATTTEFMGDGRAVR